MILNDPQTGAGGPTQTQYACRVLFRTVLNYMHSNVLCDGRMITDGVKQVAF